MLHAKRDPDGGEGVWINPLFADEAFSDVPKHQLADEPMSATAAAQIVADELMVDGNARLNLATFVTTWMEPEAQRLMADTFQKNAIDKDEYPQTAAIEERCVNILARLWNSPDHERAVGTSTLGSSEAAMLCGLALKWRWRVRRREAGAATDRPNLVMGANVQVCWEKFCRYFDVEPRLVPVDHDSYHLMPDPAAAHCDENTIGVVAILGSTYDGSYEPVAGIATALDTLAARWPGRAAACGRRQRRVHRPIPATTAGMGLPGAAGVLDQRLRSQVRARLSGGRLGDLARRRFAARRPGVSGQLPGR